MKGRPAPCRREGNAPVGPPTQSRPTEAVDGRTGLHLLLLPCPQVPEPSRLLQLPGRGMPGLRSPGPQHPRGAGTPAYQALGTVPVLLNLRLLLKSFYWAVIVICHDIQCKQRSFFSGGCF